MKKLFFLLLSIVASSAVATGQQRSFVSIPASEELSPTKALMTVQSSGTAIRWFGGNVANRNTNCLGIGPVDIYVGTDTQLVYVCKSDGTWATGIGFTASGGGGTVTSVSVVTANGFSGSVANATTTPAITINNPTALVATTSVSSPIHTSSGAMVITPGTDSTTAIQVQSAAASKIINFDTANNKVELFWDTVPSTAIGQVHIVGTNGVEREHGIIYDQYSDAQPTAKFWFRSNRGTPASPSPMLAGDGLINFAVDGQDGSGVFGGYAGYAGRMRWVATENFSSGHSGTKWSIYVSANADAAGAQVSLTQDQNRTLYVGGDVTVASPVSATISASGASGSNVAGADTIVQAGAGTGTGIGGTYRVKVAAAGTTGSSLNSYADALTIDSTKLATFPGAVTITGAATVKSLQPASNSTTAIQIFKADGTTNILDVDSTNGRVGIGTTAPTAALVVSTNAAAPPTLANVPQLLLHNTDSGVAGIASIGANKAPNFIGYRANGTGASPTVIVSTNTLSSFSAGGYDSSIYALNTAQLQFVASENWSSSAHGTQYGFFTTANTTTSLTEKVRISDAGNLNLASGSVGLGSLTAPTTVLGSTGLTKYNNVATAGWGVPAIYGSGRATAQVAANASVATYTVGAADGSFEVSANVLVTASATHSFTVTVAYTDEGNTSRVLTLSFSQLTGTLLTAITNVQGAAPYEGVPLHIRCKASTAITIATTGTFTSCTYNVEGIIRQLS